MRTVLPEDFIKHSLIDDYTIPAQNIFLFHGIPKATFWYPSPFWFCPYQPNRVVGCVLSAGMYSTHWTCDWTTQAIMITCHDHLLLVVIELINRQVFFSFKEPVRLQAQFTADLLYPMIGRFPGHVPGCRDWINVLWSPYICRRIGASDISDSSLSSAGTQSLTGG